MKLGHDKNAMLRSALYEKQNEKLPETGQTPEHSK